MADADAPGEDHIYNGALDNAAGVAQIMSIARAYYELELAPRRSIVVNFVGAEEQGLLGSLHYALNPTFPVQNIAANINVDGPGIWGPTRDLTYIGYGKSDLDAVVEEVAALQDRVVLADQFPDRGSFYRSDQFSFARPDGERVHRQAGTDAGVLSRTAALHRVQRTLITMALQSSVLCAAFAPAIRASGPFGR
jgi:Zn-dependent M28 family amino/carboxypeptidase